MALKVIFKTCRQCTAVFVGVFLMLLAWLLDAGLDAAFESSSLFDQIFHPNSHEIAVRLLFMSVQLAFMLYIVRILQRYRLQGMALEEALENAETERVRSQAILESVGDAISIQDLDLRVLYQNQAHIDSLGPHVGEFCYEAYQQKEEACPNCHIVQSYLDGRTHTTERCANTKKGLIYVEIISTPLRNAAGKIVAGIEAVRDITDRKRTELEVQRMNRELELRAQELADANRELESFNYSLSHDLRSYITRISTAQQLLTQVGADPYLQYPVRVIGESCQGMDELIDAMLTLSRLSRQEMQLEQVQLSELAQEIALHYQQQELERRVEFSVPPALRLTADPHLLRVALENLLGNAWKYTRGVSEPRVEVGTGLNDGRRFFFVRDNGIGFDMAEREKLFRPFQRLRSAEGIPGTGVGLATVERAIQRHGGTVWGEGELGKGATIYFQVPEGS